MLPILIIGAGPVGLTLALALIRRGIAVEVVEMLPELSTEARASTFHPRTLEMLAEWEVLEPLKKVGFLVHRLQYWERATRQKVAQFDYSLIANDTPYPYRLQCPQSTLTRTLKPIIEASPLAKVHMAHKLVDFTDDGDAVTATIETAEGMRQLRGRILCGADGAHSEVRRRLGIGFRGKTYEDRFLLAATDINFDAIMPDFGPVAYVFDPNEWVIVLHNPNVTRIVFRLRDDENEIAAQEEAAMRARIDQFLGQTAPYKVNGTWIYKVHQRVADRFFCGNAVLLGDAAHINNPMGGMGMNSGIHDAHRLAGQIDQILHYGADMAQAFAQYEQDRRSFAMNDVQLTTDKNYHDMSATEDEYRRRRNAEFAAAAADPRKAREFLLRAAMLL
ncbi:MAG: FAD-dependent monooxygenase [Anaerolineae bacterium]|nr:FAD-dependent monooxygenase [Anaerolineae bacterium]